MGAERRQNTCVLAGIVVTTAGTWWNERSKHTREHATIARKENRKRCEALIAAVDEELGALDDYEDQHGVFPIDMGHDFHPSRGRDMLTEIRLNCPPKIHTAAVALLDATEAWGWKGGTKEAVDSTRNEFIELVRKRL